MPSSTEITSGDPRGNLPDIWTAALSTRCSVRHVACGEREQGFRGLGLGDRGGILLSRGADVMQSA